MPKLEASGVKIVGISSDSAADSAALHERLKLNFPLLVDDDLAVIESYGVAMVGGDIAVPTVMIVMPDRRVVWKYVGESPADRPAEDEMFVELELALGEG